MNLEKPLTALLPVGSTFAIEPHPGSEAGRQARRYWLTELADASVDPADRPQLANAFELQSVGADYIRLVQSNLEGTPGHPAITLPISACAFLGV